MHDMLVLFSHDNIECPSTPRDNVFQCSKLCQRSEEVGILALHPHFLPDTHLFTSKRENFTDLIVRLYLGSSEHNSYSVT